MAGGELVFEVLDNRLATNPNMRIRQLAVNTPEFGDNTGAVDYGEALVEKHKDPSEPVRLEIADYSDPMYPYDKIRINDEAGAVIGSFPIKALHWDITSAKCGLSIELGETTPDISSQARHLLRLQRIGASREFSNNIELTGERYAWLITTRREYSGQFQTRNFWGAQTDDADSMDLPHPDMVDEDQYPIFGEGVKAVSGIPIPRDLSGSFVATTTVKSKQIEVGLVRDYVALGIDNEFRRIQWQMGEFEKYCRVQEIGSSNAEFVSTGFLYPYGWGGSGTSDTIVWYEAIMDFWTNLTVYLYNLRNLSASSPDERMHVYWDVHTDTDNYPPEDNSYHVEFNNNAGTLEFRIYEEHLGTTTEKHFSSVAMSTITNSLYCKVEIDRHAGAAEIATRIKVYHWGMGASDWTVLLDSGDLALGNRLTKSFWGVRWDMNTLSSVPPSVFVGRCLFWGDLPILNVSRDEGEHWKQCEAGVLYDISGESITGTSLKMKMDITHYHQIKGWCMAFK
jgi:hypothetical protein